VSAGFEVSDGEGGRSGAAGHGETTAGAVESDAADGVAFPEEVEGFFAARLQGPAEARAAVLEALQRNAPYPLAHIALTAGTALDVPGSVSRRVGVLAEVLRATLSVCAAAVRQEPLPGRAERAMRVLVADTLLTFTYELAADLPDAGGSAIRAMLGRALGTAGSLGWLATTAPRPLSIRALVDDAAVEAEPDRAASAFLGGALLELASSARGGEPLDPALVLEIRLTASLQERGLSGVIVPNGSVSRDLWDALAAWRAFATRHAPAALSRA
jgi:hypothetical protein